jgi:hypothetical protein
VKGHQQDHLRILLLVLRRHWIYFSPEDQDIIESLLLTGHLVRDFRSDAHSHLTLTHAGNDYLGWLSARC